MQRFTSYLVSPRSKLCRYDASTSHAGIVIRLRGPLLSFHNPVNGLRRQPLNYVHNWTSPTTKKEESPYLHAWPVPGILMLHVSVTLSINVGKGGFCSWQKKLKPGTAASCSTSSIRPDEEQKRWRPKRGQLFNDFDRVKSWKVNDCFTLLRRITNSKIFKSVNSEIVLRVKL